MMNFPADEAPPRCGLGGAKFVNGFVKWSSRNAKHIHFRP